MTKIYSSQKHIRVIAPSSHIDKTITDKAVKWLEAQGFYVSIDPQVSMRHFSAAGTIADRIAALHNAFTDPAVDFVMTACGGNGAIHLLDHIDFDLIRNNPKPFIGFSDITVLLNAIYTKTGIVTYHGPTLSQIQKTLPAEQLKQMSDILDGKYNPLVWTQLDIVKTNTETVTGRLIGGNLSVFQTLIGTQYMPDLTKPYILFLEDIGDETSRYDRMLAHLHIAGILDKAEAILFGDFHSTDTPARVPFGKTMADIIRDDTQDIACPVIMNCPFGHRDHLWTLPIGQETRITLSDNQIQIGFNA